MDKSKRKYLEKTIDLTEDVISCNENMTVMEVIIEAVKMLQMMVNHALIGINLIIKMDLVMLVWMHGVMQKLKVKKE